MNEVKIPLDRFFSHVAKTHDEVFYGVLRMLHRREKRTVSEWRALMETYRTRPVVQER